MSPDFILSFPYGSTPFFDTSNDLVFTLWYILIVIHGTIFAVVQVSVVGLLALFSVNISEHLKILQTRFMDKEYLTRQEVIRDIVKRHVELIAMKNLFNETFKIAMFLQSLCGSMHLCTIAFQILVSSEPGNVIGCIPFITNILVELFIFCYSGQIITHEVCWLKFVCFINDFFHRAFN